jgi:mono/diheme cytochrome c family protein
VPRVTLAVLAVAVLGGTPPALAQTPDPALVERGEYLARAADCTSCHTAPEPGAAPFAGGYRIPSPMGPIISSNITPSKTHGIGDYSLADFTRAVRGGVTPGGMHLYPAMPYTAYAGVTDEDIAALYAYFMLGVEPVDTSPRNTELPFPFNLRPLMIGWNLLYGGNSFSPDANASPAVQRGQYLVETLGHCGTCHTPRNALMGEEHSRFLGGGAIGGWVAPNITSDPVAGIGGWSEDEIVAFLRDGYVKGKGVAAGSMAEAVEHSLRYLTEDDLRAIAAYLKTVPPVADPGLSKPADDWTEARPVAVTSYETGNGPMQADLANATTTDGAILYNAACATCHGVDGAGTADGTFPSLTGNATVGSASPANLVLTIAGGVDREGANGHAFMQTFGEELSDAQIAAVATYVTARFGNPEVTVDEAAVTELRAGGPAPWILAAAPWLFAVAGGVVALILVGIISLLFRRSRRVVEV